MNKLSILSILLIVSLFLAGCTNKGLAQKTIKIESTASQQDNTIEPLEYSKCAINYLDFTPQNRINSADVSTYTEYIKINKNGIKKGELIKSSSMNPFINNPHNYLYFDYNKLDDLYVGDIIVYRFNKTSNFIHSICNAGRDSNGTYYTLKGYNNEYPDPVKVRKDMIKEIVVGVIY